MLPEEDYYADHRRPSGLMSQCRVCHRRHVRAWQARNGDLMRAAQARYRHSSPRRPRTPEERARRRQADRESKRRLALDPAWLEHRRAVQRAYEAGRRTDPDYRARKAEASRRYRRARRAL
jgi:hypothetical protein